MQIDYFKLHQRDGIYHFYKVFGGRGKTKNGYQEVINFLNDIPIISVRYNMLYDPKHPDKPWEPLGTWDTYEVGIQITKDEYDLAFKKATEDNFTIY